jgi:hypothetical protein
MPLKFDSINFFTSIRNHLIFDQNKFQCGLVLSSFFFSKTINNGFFCSVHWITTFKFMIGSIMILSGSLAIYLLVQLFKIQDFHKKSTNRMGPIFGLFNWVTNLFGVLTFRKPYTTFLISLFGWLFSSFLYLTLLGFVGMV